jgi:hypothetical protein
MIINLRRLVPLVQFEEPGAVIVDFTKATLEPGYEKKTLGLQQLQQDGKFWQVRIRPPITDEPARLDRWEIMVVVLPAGPLENEPVETLIVVEVRTPTTHPTVTIYAGTEPLIELVPPQPLDLWDGRNIIPVKTTFFDRLVQGEIICERGRQ